MKRILVNTIAALAIADLIWLFVFDYKIPEFSFPSSATENQIQSDKDDDLEEEEEQLLNTEVNETAETMEKHENQAAETEQTDVIVEQPVVPSEQTQVTAEQTNTNAEQPDTAAEQTVAVAQPPAPEPKAGPEVQPTQPEEKPQGADNLKKCRVLDGFYPNIRSGPGLDYDVVGQVAEGAVLSLTGERNEGWYPIRTGDGKEGYIYYDMLELLD